MKWVLPVIVVSQFFCTSLWFAGNSVMADLAQNLQADPGFLAHLTSAVQFGFISGTLVFAVLTIADRFPPSRVFFISAIVAGLFNLGITIEGIQTTELFVFRFLTGFFLAGIYPVGMKVASDYYQKGLGQSLGFLVGALVVGTAFPHLLKAFAIDWPWRSVIYSTSALSAAGGLGMLLFVPQGPYRKPGQKIDFGAFMKGFRNSKFRAAAFGYFGHMWELYAFWAFVPVMLTLYISRYPEADINISFLSFLIIGSGGLACVLGGLLSTYFGVKRIAAISLFLSCLCCLLSPLFFAGNSVSLFIAFLFFWGLVVIADSPLFSTLVAQSAAEEARGTSLTIVNCVGFSITIISIQLVSVMLTYFNAQYVFLILAIGPLFGLTALLSRHDEQAADKRAEQQ